jgi:hypothetical protein
LEELDALFGREVAVRLNDIEETTTKEEVQITHYETIDQEKKLGV